MTSTLHIVVAMKPLDGNFASNAIKHGVAGLNIDACRIGIDAITTHSRGTNGAFPKRPGESTVEESGRITDQRDKLDTETTRSGRFPSNVILSHKKGCRLVGTSKVGGDKPRGIDTAKSRSWKNQSVAGIARVGYAGEDGKEAVEQWECEEGCPVKAFPQAGNGWKKNYGEEDYKGRQYGGGTFGGGGYKGGSTYCDSGSAARFFKQVKEE